MKSHLLKVVSASRRVEMVGFFPQKLIEILREKCPPLEVHSIVLWSKDPENLLTHKALQNILREYSQIFLHFTISGMGGSFLEPGIPSYEKSLRLLPAIVNFIGDPQRVRIRFDPIVHLRLPDGSEYTNIGHFIPVAEKSVSLNLPHISISWMEAYPKVVRRLKKYGIQPIPVSNHQWKEESTWIFRKAEEIGIKVLGCCVSGLPISRCIDGELLTTLHPQRSQASLNKAKSQRVRCGCTESWDIGWYTPCPGRCLYCYANPVEPSSLIGKYPS